MSLDLSATLLVTDRLLSDTSRTTPPAPIMPNRPTSVSVESTMVRLRMTWKLPSNRPVNGVEALPILLASVVPLALMSVLSA